MPLDDFPPFRTKAHEPRLLTDAEAWELVLREHVRDRRKAAQGFRHGFTRVVFAAVMAVLCLPTVERLVLHLDVGAPPAALAMAQQS